MTPSIYIRLLSFKCFYNYMNNFDWYFMLLKRFSLRLYREWLKVSWDFYINVYLTFPLNDDFDSHYILIFVCFIQVSSLFSNVPFEEFQIRSSIRNQYRRNTYQEIRVSSRGQLIGIKFVFGLNWDVILKITNSLKIKWALSFH